MELGESDPDHKQFEDKGCRTMSDVLNAALTALNEKLGGSGIDGTLKILIEGEGALRIDESGASISDDDADCTLTADAETLQGMLSGEVDPTSAFMSGKLAVDGDMGIAMQLSSKLT